LFFTAFNVRADLSLRNPRILFAGDSHSYGKMGETLELELSKISTERSFMSSCGSSAATWLKKSGNEKTVCGFWKKEGNFEIRQIKFNNPKLEDEVDRFKPDVLIIQLGTNMAALKNPINSRDSIIELLNATTKKNVVCIWIGPPDANSNVVTRKKLEIVNQILKEETKKVSCQFIDSLKLTAFPIKNTEGIHYPNSLSKEWGLKLNSEIIEILSTVP
jgi:hypothetical protein